MDKYLTTSCGGGVTAWTRSSAVSCCIVTTSTMHPAGTSACSYLEYCQPSIYYVAPAAKYDQLLIVFSARHISTLGNGVIVYTYTDSTLQLTQALMTTSVSQNYTGNFTTFRVVLDSNANHCHSVCFTVILFCQLVHRIQQLFQYQYMQYGLALEF